MGGFHDARVDVVDCVGLGCKDIGEGMALYLGWSCYEADEGRVGAEMGDCGEGCEVFPAVGIGGADEGDGFWAR